MSDTSSDSFSEDEEKKVKETKKQDKKSKKRTANEEPATESKKGKKEEAASNKVVDEHGNEMFEFGNMRYVSVSSFKGKQYVNIREYYTDKATGKMKPGKKGIALTRPQWNSLKDFIGEIEKKFE